MPIISAPSIQATPRGHRIAASYEFNGADPPLPPGGLQALGIPLNPVGTFLLQVIGVQGAAQIGAIRTVQLSYLSFANEVPTATETDNGQLYVVVDAQQIFAFQTRRVAASGPVGPDKTCFNAVFPVEANSQSSFRFVLSLGNFGTFPLGQLWVNLFDYDLPPYFAGTST